MGKPNNLLFDTIYYNWDEIPLEHPIDVDIRHVNQIYVIDYKPLEILVEGVSHLDCEVQFQDELDMLYEEIGLEIDDNLTLAEQEIKKRILWHVGIDQSQMA